MEINYKAEDFTSHGVITEDVIKYVLDNVEDFEPRYYLALGTMEFCGCGLRNADHILFEAVADKAQEYLEGYGIDIEEICDDLEYVFG